MTYPTREEIDATIKSLQNLRKRIKGKPELALEILASLDERPLATQPEMTPKERNDRLMQVQQG